MNNKTHYIKFIKNHPVGIKKDELRKVTESSMIKFVSEEYAVEIEESEFNEYVDNIKKQRKESAINLAKEAQKEKGTNEVEEEEKEIPQYKVIDELDLEHLKIASKKQKLKIGDEVLLDENKDIKTDKDGLVTLKQGGNNQDPN